MRILIGALVLAILAGCFQARPQLSNRDPCLDFGEPQSPGFNACLERRAKALRTVLEDNGEVRYQAFEVP